MQTYRFTMKRTYVIVDWFYRLTHVLRRNRSAVLLYSLGCLLFLVVGIAVGVNVSDKAGYAALNGGTVFKYLRGGTGVVGFFFLDLSFTCAYCVFAASMFFFRFLPVFSLAPCLYRSYTLGMQTCVIVFVYTASALPMLFVFFVPVCLIEIGVMAMLSCRCYRFAGINGRCSPSRQDIKEYYGGLFPFLLLIIVCEIIKALSAALFGSALIGVIV